MKIVLLYFYSSRDEWFHLFENEYIKKINYFIPFECHPLKSKTFPEKNKQEKILEEFKQLSTFLKSSDQIILFDEKGKSFENSCEFSRFLIQNIEMGKKRLVFVVGGAYGFSKKAFSLAHHKVCLSNLTFSHPLAIATALEQVYRGLSIWKGLPYHNN